MNINRVTPYMNNGEATSQEKTIPGHINRRVRLMFTTIIPIIVIIVFSSGLYAQYPQAAGSPHGNYIFLDNLIPTEGGFEIYRAEDKKDNFQSVGTATAPKTLDELIERIRSYDTLFTDLGKYSDKDIIRMWNFISQYPVIDTLAAVNYPVMHLAAGTAFLDRTAKRGVRYRYRIDVTSGRSSSAGKITESISWPGDKKLDAPRLNNTNSDATNIYIDWYMLPDPLLFTFRVFRRQNMAGEFLKIDTERGFYSNGDTLFLIINDRSVRSRTAYEYYIEPLDRLGNHGQRSQVALVTSFTQSDVPVITSFSAKENPGTHKIDLKWRFENHDLVRSISIFRSNNFDSAFVKIAEVPSTDTAYNDNVREAMENYYYYIVLEGTMNRGYPSARVGGHAGNNQVPEPPVNVAAVTIDGGVKIHWEHLDPEVTGYYIYRDQGRNEELSQISGFIPAYKGELMTHIDTTAGLNGNLGYRYGVKSVNDGYQISEVSATTAARPGITTIVLPPSNLRGGIVNGNVLLVWDNMTELNEFLLAYKVYRRMKGETDYVTISGDYISFSQNTYTDSTAANTPGIYEYSVTSIDESGQESEKSKPLEIEIEDQSSYIFPPAAMRISRAANGIEIAWNSTENSSSSFRLFRYEPGGEPVIIAELSSETFSYTDLTVQKGSLYIYFLTAVSSTEAESNRSVEKSVRY